MGKKRSLTQPELVNTKVKQVALNRNPKKVVNADAAVTATTGAAVAVAARTDETTPSKKGAINAAKKQTVKAKHTTAAAAYDAAANIYQKRNEEVSRGLTMKQWTNGGKDWEYEREEVVINDYNQCNNNMYINI